MRHIADHLWMASSFSKRKTTVWCLFVRPSVCLSHLFLALMRSDLYEGRYDRFIYLLIDEKLVTARDTDL